MRCDCCDDFGWTCEVHPNRPFNGPRACGYGGAGMPCIVCNGDGEKPRYAHRLKSVLVVRGKQVE